MGTISSGTGLISGINIQSVVEQLMAIESRPIDQLKARVTETQQQQTAVKALSAQLLAVKAAIHPLIRPAAFMTKTATSSVPGVLTATADTTAALGTSRFVVKSLAAAQQLVSAGFADQDQTPVGISTLTFEPAKARVDSDTPLASLNGFKGVRHGVVRITDRSGASATVDLRAAITVQDVLDAINSQTGISVRAEARGGSLVVTDQTGLSAGNIVISDVNGGGAATDLGLAGTFTSAEAVGKDLLFLTGQSRLAAINDGIGLRTDGLLSDVRFELKGGEVFEVSFSDKLRFGMNLAMLNSGRGVRADEDGKRVIRITNHAGQSAEVDLSSAETLQDVANAVKGAGLSVGVSLSGGKVVLSDTSKGTSSNLQVEDVAGHAASDLGIAGDTTDTAITGGSIYRVETMADVIRAIQYAEGNHGYLSAAISADGKGLTFTDNTTGLNDTLVTAVNGSLAAYDLGLVSSRTDTERAFSGGSFTSSALLGGLNTVMLRSLNGGNGIQTGTVTFTRKAGDSFVLDFSGAGTLDDVLDRINSDGRLQASVDVGGTSISITDSSEGSGTFSASGAMADDLGLALAQDGRMVSENLQRQYISENTLLSELNQGKGITYGQIRITDSLGNSATLTLNEKAHKKLGDVIRDINGLFVNVEARINDTGDGITLEDKAGGTLTMSVSDVAGGSAAEDLCIKGSAAGTVLDAHYDQKIEIDGDDTLTDVVKKFNDANIGVRAGVINDGSGWAPYRLTLTSSSTGTAGRLAFNAGRDGMSLQTLSEGKDAVLVIGDPNSPNAVVMASSSNIVKNAVQGVTLNLVQASDSPVEVSIANDVDSVVSGITSFVSAFNGVVDQIADLTKYIPDTEEKGVLLGDGTTLQVRAQLYGALTTRLDDKSLKYKGLAEIGLTLASGAHLQFNEEKFREACDEDPDAVRKLFTLVTTDEDGKSTQVGVAAQIDNLLTRLTGSVDGTLTLRNQTLQNQVDQYNKRAAEIQSLLDKKQMQLYSRFYAMETALAQLQSQQSSLTTLSGMASAAAAG
jgi:flagellar hook-associated protein 2